MRGSLLGLVLATIGLVSLSACGSDGGAGDDELLVVTTVSPLRSIVENVGGDRVRVVGIVPEGTNSHTFDPPPSAVRDIARADLIVLNGLQLEEPSRELAESNKRDSTPILLLGDRAINPEEYVYDFSFPRSGGKPNPHLWTDPLIAADYADLVAEELARLDAEHARYYETNAANFRGRIDELDLAIRAAVETIPPSQRKLLTYHDSFPFFGPRYGFEIIGAIQPSDFSEPSAQEIGDLIVQIRESGVPAIFGSEVFASRVLDQIAKEAGAVQVDTLRDDDLPGDPGDDENTYFGLMVSNVRAMVTALGGNAAAVDDFNTSATWIPLKDLPK